MNDPASEPLEPCIYCKSDSVLREKREHVISQALGTYEQNWTLRCVCDECNGYFARELELTLGRDGAEAVLRINAGVKSAASAAKFIGRNMRFSVRATEHFDGAVTRMVPSREGSGVVPELVPQVALRRLGEKWTYIPESSMTTDAFREWIDASEVEVKILAPSGESQRLLDRLQDFGFAISLTRLVRDRSPFDEGPVAIDHEFTVTVAHQRAAAKIVFNYGARVLGPETMRRPEFDRCRKFVRYGIEPSPVVAVTETAILVGPTANTSKTHALGIQWMEERGALVGLLRVFNHHNYGVVLSEGGKDWSGFRSHHLFDPVARTITDVTPR